MPPQAPPNRTVRTRREQVEYQNHLNLQHHNVVQREHTSKNPEAFRPSHETFVALKIASGKEDQFWKALHEAYLCDEDRDAVLQGAVELVWGWSPASGELKKLVTEWLGSEKQPASMKIRGVQGFTGEIGKWLEVAMRGWEKEQRAEKKPVYERHLVASPGTGAMVWEIWTPPELAQLAPLIQPPGQELEDVSGEAEGGSEEHADGGEVTEDDGDSVSTLTEAEDRVVAGP